MSVLIHYVIVRRDLPLGVMAAHLIHAAGESGAEWGHLYSPLGLPDNTIAVALEATDEPHLKDIRVYLQGQGLHEGIDIFTIIESGGTFEGQFMAVGLLPMKRDKIGPIVSQLSILRDREGLDNYDDQC